MIVRRNIKIKHDLRVPLLTSLCGEPFSSSKLQLVLSILYSTKSFDQTHLAIYIYTHRHKKLLAHVNGNFHVV